MSATAAAPLPAWHARVGRLEVALGCVLIAALFALCHPYAGLGGDASIYMMRALADLDPAGLGRDLMVADDGQMRFSLFPWLARPLVAALGAAQAAMLVAALGSAAWLAALAALATRLAPGRIAVAMVAMVAVLPQGYGGFGLFRFAETAATPRPLAEAAVLAALAALLAGRTGLALAALAVAALLHPIMAAPGVGVAALMLVWRFRVPARLVALALIALAAAAAFGAGLAGLPPFDRLVARPDAAWLALLRLHSPQLFPTLWPAESLCAPLAQAATILVAAHRAPPSRPVYLAVLAVGAAGLAAAVALGDTLNLLVVLQAQVWRAAWLVGVLGGCALAFCTAVLWPDARGRIVLALLALAWFVQPTPALTLAVGGLALLLEFGSVGARLPLTLRQAGLVLAAVALLSVWWASGTVLGYLAFLRGLPPDTSPSLIAPLRNNMESLPLFVAIAAWLDAPAGLLARSPRVVALAVLCAGLVGVDLLTWDQRSVAQANLEHPHDPPGLATLAAGRGPEVLWLDDESDAWFALGRPQYFSRQQAVSMVFSRTLALEWARRADILIGLGLAPRSVFTPQRPEADDRTNVTQAGIDAFCARTDAPGLVLVPREGGAPSLRDMIVWRLPAPLVRPERAGSSIVERRIEGFGIVPCATPRAVAKEAPSRREGGAASRPERSAATLPR